MAEADRAKEAPEGEYAPLKLNHSRKRNRNLKPNRSRKHNRNRNRSLRQASVPVVAGAGAEEGRLPLLGLRQLLCGHLRRPGRQPCRAYLHGWFDREVLKAKF